MDSKQTKVLKEENTAEEVMEMYPKNIDYNKQAVWFRKTFQRPQKSRHTRTKRGRK